MSENARLAGRLVDSVGLKHPPVAVHLCAEVPADIPLFKGVTPGGCVFWQEALQRVFATTADNHRLCSIGIHTHNLVGAPRGQAEELRDALQAMTGLDYIREAEVEEIPVLNREVAHAVYGPLADFPVDPDLVLLFAHSSQGLVLSEAVARVDGDAPPAMGRPACAIVPQALNGQTAAMSLGCCGARAYLDVFSDEIALWALPGSALARYCDEIEILAGANRTLTRFHERRRQDVEAGEQPTVKDSLGRM